MTFLTQKHILKIVNGDLKAWPIVQYQIEKPIHLFLERHTIQGNENDVFFILCIVYENERINIQSSWIDLKQFKLTTSIPFQKYVKLEMKNGTVKPMTQKEIDKTKYVPDNQTIEYTTERYSALPEKPTYDNCFKFQEKPKEQEK